jgi:hypothetical protein
MIAEEQRAERKRAALIEEERHYETLRRVFSTADGADVLEWILTDLCGYWRVRLDGERELGKFELGRHLFNQVCMADIGIIHNMLDPRRKAAEAVRIEERRKMEKGTRNG